MSNQGAQRLQTLQQKRRSRRTKRFDHGQPIAKIDTRPMAFVFAMLPILVLWTAPTTTHAVVFDIPDTTFIERFSAESEASLPDPQKDESVKVDTNIVSISRHDQLLWNGQPVTPPQLRKILDTSVTVIPEPVLLFEPEPLAGYDTSARTLAIIRASGATGKFRFGGLQEHCYFDLGGPRVGGGSSLTISVSIVIDDTTPAHAPLPDHSEICDLPEGGRR